MRKFSIGNLLGLLGLGWGLLLLTIPAEAATYHVATNGNDGNSGTQSAPFRTIAKGLSVMAAGDTFYIRGGTYDEALRDNVPGGTDWATPVTIAALPGETVVIRPSGGYYVVQLTQPHEHHIIFDGLIFDGSQTISTVFQINVGGDQPTKGAHHLRIKNSEMRNGDDNGIFVGGGSDDNEFINLNIHDNGLTCSGCSTGPPGGYGLYVRGKRNLIQGCSVSGNGGSGMQLWWDSGGVDENMVINNRWFKNGVTAGRGGFSIGNGNNNQAYNNLVWGNTGPGIRVSWSVSNTSVDHNTIWNNTESGIYINASTNAILKNNIVYQNGGTITDIDGVGTLQSTNLTADPRFVNPAVGDFHLQPSSPAIDAGLTLPEVPTDFDGVSRPQGLAYDVGAYEYRTTTLLPGDLNKDGKRDLADVRLLIYMLIGQQPTTPEADLTGDGAVTLADVQALIRLFAS